MKKLTLLLLIGLFINSCEKEKKQPTLSDFCGQSATYSNYDEFNHDYLLGFEKTKGTGVETIVVTRADYYTYKDGKPISCR
ncbi:MAG: hypothetical protein KBB86_02720 [Candidatus Pacebacteria bacterium]|nr:hypothetical protein [Candidatus Paceibacterota bacterium]